jgi:hypothetical protein
MVTCEVQDYLEDLDVDGKVMLSRSSINRMGGGRDRIRRVKGFFEHGDETSSGSVL